MKRVSRPAPGSGIPDALTAPLPQCPEGICNGSGWLSAERCTPCACATPQEPVYVRHPRPNADADRWEWLQWETDRAAERAERERERRGY